MSGALAERHLPGARALVTGASGFLGTALCRALRAAGAEVHALSRYPRNGWHLGDLHLGDLTDAASLERAVRESSPDFVFHLAAYGTTYAERDRERAVAVNIAGSLALWDALGKRDVRFIVAGSCGEYGDVRGLAREDQACVPTWFYPATKNAMVTLLTTLGRETGREVVVLRPFGPYGPGDVSDRLVPAVAARLVAGETVETTAGEQLRDFLHVDDHVRAFLLAATRALPATGAIYNVGSGKPVRLRQVIETLARAVGGDALERVRFGALPYRSNEVWELCASTDAARHDLDFTPTIGLEEGLRGTVDWHRQRLAEAAS